MREILEVLGLILVFAGIVIFCYYTTKFIGKKFNGQTTGRNKNKHMRVAETLPIGMDKCLYLILIGEQYFLFMSSKKGFELVSEIQLEEQIEDLEEENAQGGIFDFKRIFDIYSGTGNRKGKNTEKSEVSETPDKKSISDSLNKLKSINSNNH